MKPLRTGDDDVADMIAILVCASLETNRHTNLGGPQKKRQLVLCEPLLAVASSGEFVEHDR